MAMERSRSQVLYQYLPGNTFDYSNQRGIWQVRRLETRDVSGKIDTNYVVNRVLARVGNWEGGATGFPSHHDSYYFGSPESVEARPYPPSFECQKCSKAHHYWDPDDLATENPGLVCDNCGGNLKQYQFVSVHSCGNISELKPQRCPSHGLRHIELDRRDSQKVRNFHWHCLVDGCGWDTPIRFTQQCGCEYQPPSATPGDEDTMYTTVHRAGSAYYPHYFTTVNLHAAGMGHLRNSRSGAYRAFARLFELADPGDIADIDLSAQVGDVEVDEDEVVRVYQDNEGMSLSEAEEHVRAQAGAGGQTITARLNDLIALDEESEDDDRLLDAGDELLQYGLGLEELTTSNLAELEEEARRRDFPKKADRISTYEALIDGLGFRGVRVIEDFPVQTFVYGYTRGSREENGARINAFSTNDSDGDGTPIFVDTSETEGVQFDLDPVDVLLWLAINDPGVSDPDLVNGPVCLPSLDDTSPAEIDHARTQIEEMGTDEQWAFILNHLPDVDNYGRFVLELEDTVAGDVTEHVFELLHTLSHILLKQASTVSGFDRTNLSEFLFPRALSIVIYSNNREEFNIGGMTTMIEQDLDTLLGQAEHHGNDCVYDPVCSERGGSCLSCLHVSEISCSYFNQVLSRDYLYGSRPNTDRDVTGFWEL